MTQIKTKLPTPLGRLVRFWRNTFNLSQEELALELESSTRHISRLENGRVHPSQEVVLKIASYLNLKKRDTANLLIAGGYIPKPQKVAFHSDEYRWLRKVMAINLEALDPFPAMFTNGAKDIVMVNKSWLGLFNNELEMGNQLFLSDFFSVIIDKIALRSSDLQRVNLIAGLLLTLKQEALIYDETSFDDLVNNSVEKYSLPSNWAEIAAKNEPTMSFPIGFEVGGKLQDFFHISNSVTSMGPATGVMESGFVMIKLFPRDLTLDLSHLANHEMDHPLLYKHHINQQR